MSQLVIVDIQNKFSIWFNQGDLLKDVKEISKNYSSIVYLWDNIDGDEFEDEIPEEWDDSFEMDDETGSEIMFDGFYRKFSHIIEKQYGFFRSYMDIASREDIVLLGKFMLQNDICDLREIEFDDELEKSFRYLFNKGIVKFYEAGEGFIMPMDLISEIQNSFINGLTLVGGGVDECLAEVSLLLDILDIEHKIELSLTY